MFGFGSQAAAQPPVDPTAAQPVPQQALLPGQPGYSPSKVDMLIDMLWNGHSPMDASSAVRGRDAAVYQQQLMRQVYTKAQQDDPSGHQLTAMLFNPSEYGKSVSANFAPVTTAAGATQTMYGGPTAGGSVFMAPEFYRDDKSGTVGVQTQGGNLIQDRLGGDISAANGLVLSGRNGVLGTYSTPQTIAPGSTGVPFSPSVSGGVSGAPMIQGALAPAMGGQGGASTPASAAPAGAAPRGLRNNNPGNIMTLPSGHMWDGQTGVDPSGYAIFGTPEAGMRAAVTNLNTYATKHGIDTVSGVVSRWAPASAGNNTANYAAYIAQQMGVKPDQKLNMSDPRVQHGILSGIFSFENTPAAMASWRPQGNAPAAQGVAQPAASGGGYGQPFAHGREPTPMSADERHRWSIPDSDPRQYMTGPDGKPAPLAEAAYGPKEVLGQRNEFFKSPEYTDYANSVNAANAIEAQLASFNKNNSVVDQAAVDNSIRAMTGLSAKQGSVTNFMDHLGLPDQLKGQIMRSVGAGYITPDVLMQMRDMIHAYVAGHKPLAQQRLDNEASYAQAQGQKFGVTLPEAQPRNDVPWLDGKGQRHDPQPVAVGSPEEAMKLPPGTRIKLPDGRLGRVPAR